MPKGLSEEQKQEWKKRVIDQRSSGLSAAKWCSQNKIANNTFHYWSKKLFPVPAVTSSSFTEISIEKRDPCLESKDSGIKVEYQEIYIHLDKCFDPKTLKQCLSALKEASC